MSDETRHAQLVAWLQNEGHSETDIEKIIAKVAEYDAKTVHESVFDSIDDGRFSIQKIIEEAMQE